MTTPTTTRRPRGICPVCDRDMPVLKSGRIQAHLARRRRQGVRWPCDGEGRPPRWPATAVVPDDQEDR